MFPIPCDFHLPLAASGFEFALQQPLFPGKLILWLLFMLSLLTWSIIVSKAITLWRMRRSDAEFTRHFRESRQPLELFERDYEDDLSMRWVVYQHGAKEAAYQMLGSPVRDETFSARLKGSDRLRRGQLESVREAFGRGKEAALAKMRDGLPILSATASGAPFVGLLGMGWILMKTFNGAPQNAQLGALSPGISGALAVLVVALLVTTPALFGHIVVAAIGRERMRLLEEFRADMFRLFERRYGRRDADAAEESAVTVEKPATERPFEDEGEFDDPGLETAVEDEEEWDTPDVEAASAPPMSAKAAAALAVSSAVVEDRIPEAPPRQQDLFADIRKSLASEAPKLPVSFAETEEAFADSEEEEAFAEAEDDDDDFESPFILAEDDLDDDETDAEISRVGSIETPAFADEDEDEDFEAEAREPFVITELPNPVADAAAAEARTGLEAGDIGDEEAETEEGYYRTPFSEPRINPIALQTARLMAAASH